MAVDLVRQVPALDHENAIRQGADAETTLVFYDATGAFRNLTGYTLYAEIRDQRFEDAERGPMVEEWTVDAATSDLANGLFVLRIARARTTLIAPGPYLWDALLRRPDGSILTHLAPNIVTVIPGVTEPPV